MRRLLELLSLRLHMCCFSLLSAVFKKMLWSLSFLDLWFGGFCSHNSWPVFLHLYRRPSFLFCASKPSLTRELGRWRLLSSCMLCSVWTCVLLLLSFVCVCHRLHSWNQLFFKGTECVLSYLRHTDEPTGGADRLLYSAFHLLPFHLIFFFQGVFISLLNVPTPSSWRPHFH